MIENYIIMFLGFIPVIYSGVKVERHYTNYYTAKWNFYGSVVFIVGMIFEYIAEVVIVICGILTISILTLIVFLSTYFNNAQIIRLFGKSVVQVGIQVFFFVFSLFLNFGDLSSTSYIESAVFLSVLLAFMAAAFLYAAAEESARETAAKNRYAHPTRRKRENKRISRQMKKYRRGRFGYW